jgi:trans-aconitate methyltransferase
MDRRAHWNQVYETKADDEVSWYEASPAASLSRIRDCGLPSDSAIIDIGGGTSRLVDALAAVGFSDLTVLDVSAAALARARDRFAGEARVHWIEADITTFAPSRAYDLWHDRAAFHFLTDPADRHAYGRVAQRAVAPGGWVVIGAFAPDGPERCSGLAVQRHDDDSFAQTLGPRFVHVDGDAVEHITPSGGIQRFHFSRFRRVDP